MVEFQGEEEEGPKLSKDPEEEKVKNFLGRFRLNEGKYLEEWHFFGGMWSNYWKPAKLKIRIHSFENKEGCIPV